MTWAVWALAGLTVLAYGQTLTAGFVYDDANWTQHGDVRGALWPFALVWWLSGGLPRGLHMLVLGLHLLNGWLLWTVARRWLSPVAAVVVLTLFWLHPLQVENVAYVTGGFEVLLTTYVLLALVLLYRWQLWSIAAAVACLTLAVQVKWSALPLVVVVPALVAVDAKRSGGFLFCALLPVAGLVGTAAAGVWGFGWYAAQTITPMWAHVRQVSLALWRYLGLVVWPSGFSIEHDWVHVDAGLGGVALAGLLLAGVLAFTWRAWWAPPWMAWLWIVALVAPRALVPHDGSPLTEHHVYLPFLAIWCLVGAATDRVLMSSRSFSWSLR